MFFKKTNALPKQSNKTEKSKLDKIFYKGVLTPFLLANAFAFGLSFTDARDTLLTGKDPALNTPITVALAMKAMGATYKDTVGLNPKSLGHAAVYSGLGWGDALGKLGAIYVMKGDISQDQMSMTLPNLPDIQARSVAAGTINATQG